MKLIRARAWPTKVRNKTMKLCFVNSAIKWFSNEYWFYFGMTTQTVNLVVVDEPFAINWWGTKPK